MNMAPPPFPIGTRNAEEVLFLDGMLLRRRPVPQPSTSVWVLPFALFVGTFPAACGRLK